jgi:hypothetical protein
MVLFPGREMARIRAREQKNVQLGIERLERAYQLKPALFRRQAQIDDSALRLVCFGFPERRWGITRFNRLEAVFTQQQAADKKLILVVVREKDLHCAKVIWAITIRGMAWFQISGSASNGKRKRRVSPGFNAADFASRIGTRSR